MNVKVVYRQAGVLKKIFFPSGKFFKETFLWEIAENWGSNKEVFARSAENFQTLEVKSPKKTERDYFQSIHRQFLQFKSIHRQFSPTIQSNFWNLSVRFMKTKPFCRQGHWQPDTIKQACWPAQRPPSCILAGFSAGTCLQNYSLLF